MVLSKGDIFVKDGNTYEIQDLWIKKGNTLMTVYNMEYDEFKTVNKDVMVKLLNGAARI